MERIPEPQALMDDPAQARAYAQANFDEPHAQFMALLHDKFPLLARSGTALDLGCGPGDITLRFARRFSGWQVHGVDGAMAMLAEGERLLARESPQVRRRVTLFHGVLPQVDLPLSRYPFLLSNSLLHHLPDPTILWQTVQDLASPGSPLFLMDLCRPATRQDAADLVERHAGREPEQLKEDFYNSLLAAFTPGEVKAQLATAGLDHLTVAQVSDHHLLVWGLAG